MKIKILVECDPQSLEKLVNEFIADKQVIDIKFKINDYPDYFALVMYEDKQHVRLDICGAILSDISISNSVSRRIVEDDF